MDTANVEHETTSIRKFIHIVGVVVGMVTTHKRTKFRRLANHNASTFTSSDTY